MSKYGFLDVLEEEMDKVFPFDYEINWDKKNHAVEVAFLLEAQNTGGVALVDEAGEESDEDIFFEEAVLFYNPAKSHVDEDAYLTAIPYEPKKGLSREFLAYFATLDELMDFLADEEAESFEIVWNQEIFEEGKVGLEESTFYPYPRY